MSRPAAALAAAVLASAAALGLAGCGGSGSADTATAATTSAGSTAAAPGVPVAPASPSVPATPAPPAVAAPGSSTGPSSRPAVTTHRSLQLSGPRPLRSTRAVVPSRLEIPSIGVDSTFEHLALRDGVLQPPVDPLRAGWWAGGPVPGDPGPAVIAGHLDSYTGPAVFIHLLDLKAGDRVYVTRSDGTRAAFVVDSVQTYTKSAFPTRAVYGTTPGSALRLITCGGTFDRQRQLYLSNVVAYASLVS